MSSSLKESLFGKSERSDGELFQPVLSSATTVAEADKPTRLGFIRKVYGILSIQLAVTAFICALAMKLTSPGLVGGYHILSFGTFLASAQWFQWLTFGLSLILLLCLFAFAYKHPLNMILLTLWTVAMSMSVATSCAMVVCDPMTVDKGLHVPASIASPAATLAQGNIMCAVGTVYADQGGNAVIMAASITAIIFFSLTAFTIQSKWDFSFLGAGLFAAVWILILWGIMMSFFGGGANMRYAFALVGAVIFSLYIVFDTWLITQKLGPDDYIHGAISLYLDIINLFLMILSLLDGRRG
mmetsp:Transcript_21756/g.51642  ORF Transcript_21756/g.51642 Transcript_21756/m.51642 type:complete len:298 (-) Transcript_21756:309-1202(-)